MDKVVKAKWVAALRSGKWKQSKKALRDEGNGRCCLGVLAEVNGAKWETNGDMRWDFYFGNGTGLRYEDASTLATMNDSGSTFAQIADWIEENL